MVWHNVYLVMMIVGLLKINEIRVLSSFGNTKVCPGLQVKG